MANRVRLRSGQVQLVKMRVKPETVIEAGDLVIAQKGDDGRKYLLSLKEWKPQMGDPSEVFVGVSHQPSAHGEDSDLSVDISPLAVYEFDVMDTLTTDHLEYKRYEVGDALYPWWNSPKEVGMVGYFEPQILTSRRQRVPAYLKKNFLTGLGEASIELNFNAKIRPIARAVEYREGYDTLRISLMSPLFY